MPKVLVVDDVCDLREFLAQALFEAGFDVVASSNVAEAKDYLRREELDCAVLLDLGLPDKPGQDLLEWIRLHPRHRTAPVIIITADARVKAVPGSMAVMIKPLDMDNLLQLLNAHRARWTN